MLELGICWRRILELRFVGGDWNVGALHLLKEIECWSLEFVGGESLSLDLLEEILMLELWICWRRFEFVGWRVGIVGSIFEFVGGRFELLDVDLHLSDQKLV